MSGLPVCFPVCALLSCCCSAAAVILAALTLTPSISRLRVLQGVLFSSLNQLAGLAGLLMLVGGVYVVVDGGSRSPSLLVKAALGVGGFLTLLAGLGLAGARCRHPGVLYLHCFLCALLFGGVGYGVYYAIEKARRAREIVDSMTTLERAVRVPRLRPPPTVANFPSVERGGGGRAAGAGQSRVSS